MSRTVLIVGPSRIPPSSAAWPRVVSFEEAFRQAGWHVERGYELADESPPDQHSGGRLPIPVQAVRALARLGIADEIQFRNLGRAAGVLRRTRHDLVVATIPPFSLVACTVLTEEPVVVDYRDVFGLTSRPHPVARMLVSAERMAARRASLITYAGGARLGQDLADALRTGQPQIQRIPNGIMPADLQGLPAPDTADRDGPLDVAWEGHLYGFADLTPVLKALELCPQGSAHLTVIGPTPPAARRRYVPGTSTSVSFTPAMSRKALYERLRQADIGLIVLTRNYPYEVSVPAKYYDYAASGIPILYIGPDRAALMDEPRNSLLHHFSPENVKGISRFLQRAAEDRQVLGPRGECITEIDRVRSAALLVNAVEAH